MQQCPTCGRYMNFNMTYSAGAPLIFYSCSCGYDTRNQNNIASTTYTYGDTINKGNSQLLCKGNQPS